jgi:hypothetical protein
MPDKYVLIVAALSFLTLASQSINARVLALVKGRSIQTPVSFQHKSNIVCAVLYELQVLLVTPRLPQIANDSVISLGSSKAHRNVVVQPPAVP